MPLDPEDNRSKSDIGAEEDFLCITENPGRKPRLPTSPSFQGLFAVRPAHTQSPADLRQQGAQLSGHLGGRVRGDQRVDPRKHLPSRVAPEAFFVYTWGLAQSYLGKRVGSWYCTECVPRSEYNFRFYTYPDGSGRGAKFLHVACGTGPRRFSVRSAWVK